MKWAAERGLSLTMHWNNDASVGQLLSIFERVDRDVPIAGLRWSIAHLNDASPATLMRMKALGLGWTVQDAMYFGGEGYVQQAGAEAARRVPPVNTGTKIGVPIGGGTDAHRVMSYNPFVALQWMLDGRTVGGLATRDADETPSREEALRLYTQGSSWFSTEDGSKGGLYGGQLADFAVLTNDYFRIPADEIKHLESQLTVVGGEIVHASHDFQSLAPPPLPAALDWAPTAHYGGYHQAIPESAAPSIHNCSRHSHATKPHKLGEAIWGLGCDCFAF